ncbi:uncharacterized protein LOC103701601 isoform X1 [Phoenix dactylifera]|uniref:Uncharacterized protein LOC103701601 isoform X1 n=1 Tax=Phoenix dactylifera TaxID=42345 RepID=A0A8B7BN60_PHODC|nr:uncharacterized protein LOC103701601 isoform X1 [Phoenix dactylifera]
MVPAQELADVDEERMPDTIVKSESEEVSREKMMTSDAACSVSANNCEDNGFYAESSCDPQYVDDNMDQDIDILDCNDVVAIDKVKDEDPDAPESSSSFGDTSSGSDHESKLNQSDVEMDSGFGVMNDNPAVFDGFHKVFKKKKVTAHWRKFISPLMWRCQWLELRIKELRLQALKYDKELGAYKNEKELQSKMVELDGCVSRSVPLTGRSPPKQVMKRRKRKRNEDIADISSYMSNHHIFSYNENKKTETDGRSVDDDYGDQADENVRGAEDNAWLLGTKGHDSLLEQILLNIEAVQSRVLKLKTSLNKVMCRNAMGISSSPGNLFSSGLPPSYAQSHIGSPENNGDGLPVGAIGTPPHLVTEYEMGDMVMPESAVSSYGDAADVDIIESTMGLLSAVDGPLDQHQIRDLCKDSADDVLIDNQAAEEEFQKFEKVSHPRERPQELVKEAGSPSEEESIAPKVSTPEPGPEIENVELSQQTVLKPCCSGKRRGRKPKRKQRGGSVAALSNLRSERLRRHRILGRKS